MIHFEEEYCGVSACGVQFLGKIARQMITDDVDKTTCIKCQSNQFFQKIRNRKREREAHLELKNWWAKDISAQEARAMREAHTWQPMEEGEGD